MVGLGAGGVLGAIAASTWSTNYVATADSILVFFLPVFRETRDVLAATAVSLQSPDYNYVQAIRSILY